jgi:hypothetical protein
MEKWLSYSLHDILMFSSRVYYRLIAQYNAELWLARYVALALGTVLLLALLRRGEREERAAFAILGGFWLWTGHAFLLQRFTPINWPMEYVGAAFLVQGALLVGLGALAGRLTLARRTDWPAAALLIGALLYPVVAPLAGRSWQESEVIGFMPDPTAMATFAILAASRGPVRWAFMLLPLVWLAISAVTLHTLGSPDFFVPAAAAVLGLSVVLRRRGERG